jgi:toxin ParE1/3/4
MTVVMFPEAEDDVDNAFDYYEQRQLGLGREFLDEFRRAIELILQYPNGWQALDMVYRRYRLRRFPYGIVYRLDEAAARIVVVTLMHLSLKPDQWRDRERK